MYKTVKKVTWGQFVVNVLAGMEKGTNILLRWAQINAKSVDHYFKKVSYYLD